MLGGLSSFLPRMSISYLAQPPLPFLTLSIHFLNGDEEDEAPQHGPTSGSCEQDMGVSVRPWYVPSLCTDINTEHTPNALQRQRSEYRPRLAMEFR
jgi:hypothetical protein